MTAVTDAAAPAVASPAPRGRLTFGGVLRSEWIKLITLRSTMWCYLIMLVISLALGLLLTAVLEPDTADGTGRQTIWVQVATLGIGFSQLVSVVLGALMITGEYGTGMIRSTMTAVPARLPALVGKALVFGVVTFVVGLVSIVATALVSAPLLASKGAAPDLADGAAWLSMVGGAGYLALIGVLALSIGAILRNGAGAIAAGMGLILVLPTALQIIAGITQAIWVQNLIAFLPSSAAQMYAYGPLLAQSTPVSSELITLDPAQGALMLGAWVVVAFALALVLLRRRDV